jgi:ATP adenylyltransferase
MMDRIWAPWRVDYIAATPPASDPGGCFICRGLADHDDRKNGIVVRTSASVVLLNRYPYNNGHLLVAPLAHKSDFFALTDPERLDGQRLIERMIERLSATLRPDGFNIGVNLGRVAGAGLPGHLHWHVVPRWNGDTNFMPVLADTKVISQSLEALYDLLVAAENQAK